MRIRIALLLSLALLFSTVAAVNAKTLDIVFWHMEVPPHRVAAFQKVIDEFNAANPGINISQQTVSWGDANQRLMAAIGAGNPPDFTFVNDSVAVALWTTGAIQPVDDIIAELDSLYKFVPSNVAPFEHHGHIWAVPMFTLTHLFYYRTDLAEKAGFNKAPETWDELIELVSAMHGIEPDVAGIALPASKHKFTQQCFCDFMITNGANIFDADGNVAFNNERVVEALTAYQELLKYSVPDAASLEWSGAELTFATGRAASMFFFGSLFKQVEDSGIVSGKFNAILPPIPAEGGRVGSINSHNAISIFTKDAARRQAIKDFLVFWLEPERYGRFLAEAEPGLYVPVHEAAMDSEAFWGHPIIAKYEDHVRLGFKAQETDYAYNIGFAPDHPLVEAAGDVDGSLLLAEVVQKVAFGEMTPAEAAAWGEEQLKWLVE